MDELRREDDERQLPENHIYLTLPGVNKPVVIFFPADKYTTLVIIAMLCATLVLGTYLIFVKGDQENVAGVFGNKPAVATARATAPAALCPCERPTERRSLPEAPEPPASGKRVVPPGASREAVRGRQARKALELAP
jgi:hypothetical protein